MVGPSIKKAAIIKAIHHLEVPGFFSELIAKTGLLVDFTGTCSTTDALDNTVCALDGVACALGAATGAVDAAAVVEGSHFCSCTFLQL